jgi:hypothetical protein
VPESFLAKLNSFSYVVMYQLLFPHWVQTFASCKYSLSKSKIAFQKKVGTSRSSNLHQKCKATVNSLRSSGRRPKVSLQKADDQRRCFRQEGHGGNQYLLPTHQVQNPRRCLNTDHQKWHPSLNIRQTCFASECYIEDSQEEKLNGLYRDSS